VQRIRELAEEADRDPSSLSIALIDGIVVTDHPLEGDRSPLHGTPEQITEGLRAFADAGLQHLVAGIRSAGDQTYAGCVAAIDVVATEVLPHL
jgi:hypothetical protein